MKPFPSFILASKSPRRREMLTEAGYRFRAVAPRVSEPAYIPPGVPPAQLAEALAYFKARSVAEILPHEIVLGADTVVTSARRTFGKAADAGEARYMLRGLSGMCHSVTTGLAILTPAPPGRTRPCRYIASDTTVIVMRHLSDEEIDAYVASGEWRDKAGAYAIQETADAFVDHIEGSYTNVVGLPMELLERMLGNVRRDMEKDED